LVIYLDFITPLVGSQSQADDICFEFSIDFDLFPHTLLLQKLSAFGLSVGYENWFCCYLTNRQTDRQVRVFGILSSPSAALSGVPQDLFWGLCFLTYSLMTRVM
jgi:hypothetical protein